MIQRILAIVQKELTQVLRDRITLIVMLTVPLVQLILFGYAISTNVQHIPMVVADESMDSSSRDYISAMVNSSYFDIEETALDENGVMNAIEAGRAQVGLVIPPNFRADVRRGDAQTMVLIDGSDFFTAQSAYGAANAIGQAFALQVITQDVSQMSAGAMTLPSIDAHTRILFNPDIKDLWFIIPGMLAMLIQVQTITLTAMAVVREREVGTIEQILVTPIRPIELMIGKTVPYMFIALFNMATILVLGMFWFGVPFQGSLLLFIGLIFLYIICGLGLGLLISTVSQNQRQAQQLVGLVMMMAMILGGFYFPRDAMPLVIKWIGDLFPLTYFVPISRGIMTRGVGLAPLVGSVAALVIYLVVVLALTSRSFREKLE